MQHVGFLFASAKEILCNYSWINYSSLLCVCMCVFVSVTTVLLHCHLKLNTEIVSNVSGHCCCFILSWIIVKWNLFAFKSALLLVDLWRNSWHKGMVGTYKGNKTKRQNSASIKYEKPMLIEESLLLLFLGVWFQPHRRGDEPHWKPE